MPLAIRRLVFYLLVVIFLIAAPLLIGYTAGYRYHFKQKSIVKTGVLIIETTPEGAKVILDGRLRKERTPARLANLLPGTYEITLTSEKFHPWSKALEIKSAQTTFATEIVLLKQALPTLLDSSTPFPNETNTASRSTDALHYELRQANHEVWEINPRTGEERLITRLLEEIKKVTPLPQGGVFILTLADRIRAIELDLRDRQNNWDLAFFDSIKKTTLSENGKTLYIFGTNEGKEGVWKIELQ